jgi:DNA-binding transcriptional ArsR family regulator
MPEESSHNHHERAEISEHLIAVWLVFQHTDLPPWLDSREIAAASGVALRTARQHVKYLFDLGLLDREEAYPRHLYHLSQWAARRHPRMYKRLHVHAAIVQARQRYTEQRRARKDGELGAS